MSNFRVGMKVVCIATPWDESSLWEPWRKLVPNRPILRGVYTVRGACPSQDEPGIYLCEIMNPMGRFNIGWHEGGFCCEFFRPVVERKTSIEVFRKLLQPKTENVA